MGRYSLGIEFTDDEVLALLASIRGGTVAAHAAVPISAQSPQQWLASSSHACRRVMQLAGASVDDVVGVGVACTRGMLRLVANLLSSRRAAEPLGFPQHLPVAPAVCSAHAAVYGCGVAAPSTLVMVISMQRPVYLLNSRIEAVVPDVVGPVPDGILPGYFAYEFSQGCIADAVTSALELRAMCERIRAAGVPVRRFVCAGQFGEDAARILQVFADVLDARIRLPQSDRPVALGAAVRGCLAAGPDRTGHASLSQAIHAMARQRDDPVYRPDLRAHRSFDRLYADYRARLPIPSDRPRV